MQSAHHPWQQAPLCVYSFNRRWEPIAFKIRQKYSHFFGRCICIHSFETQITESDSLPSRFEEISRGGINGRNGGNHRAHRSWKAEMMERETRWKQTIGSLTHKARPLWQELLHPITNSWNQPFHKWIRQIKVSKKVVGLVEVSKVLMIHGFLILSFTIAN